MADIIQIAEKLNSEVTRLNNERSKMEGMLESAKTNYEKAVKAYEMKYGVKLTEETLQQEFNEVFARTKGSILDLQEKIESIQRGDYKKVEEVVEYDLEPNVEPIRAEVKPEPEKKKRSRKKKEAVEAVAETPIAETVIEAEEIVPQVEVSDVSNVKEEAPVIPQTEDVPFKLDLNFDGFEANTVINVPQVEEVKEVPKKKEAPKARKPLTAADISAAVAAADTVKQNPVTMPTMSTEDDDDEVDLGTIAMGTPFGEKPTMGETPTEPKLDFGFGSFGDIAGFGAVKEPAPVVEEKPAVTETVSDFGGFGNFGGFGGFGGFGDIAESNPPKVEETPAKKTEDVIPGDGFSFGGLGDFGVTSQPTVEPKKEEKKETITPDGWGVNNNFGGFGDFSSLLNSPDFKFGK
jgi:hypothetical protein